MYDYGNHRRVTLFAKEPRKQRIGSGDWEQATNRQQRRLTRAFDSWSAATRRLIDRAASRGAPAQERLRIFEGEIPALEATLTEIIEKGTRAAARLSAGDRVSTPEIEALIRETVAESLDMVRTGLIPNIREKLLPEIATGAAADKKAMREAFNVVRAGPGLLAGQFWVMIFATQRSLGRTRELERRSQGLPVEAIRWVLDPRAEHCADSGTHLGCPGLAGEYPQGWDTLPTVPAGRTTCRGNCRCHLETKVDGQWQRGLVEA